MQERGHTTGSRGAARWILPDDVMGSQLSKMKCDFHTCVGGVEGHQIYYYPPMSGRRGHDSLTCQIG